MTRLATLAENTKMTVRPGEARMNWDKRDEWQKNANDYRITLTHNGHSMSFDYWQGVAIKTQPDRKAVLECVLTDAQAAGDSFEDFCNNFGYDLDSRTHYATFLACQRTLRAVTRVFGEGFEDELYDEDES